jgi:biotin synthase
MIRVAVGTANVLNLVDIRAAVHPTTAHLLTSGKCIYDCKFCTQARSSVSSEKLLSRISWPEYEEKVVFAALSENQEKFKRVCLQVVHSKEKEDHLGYVGRIKDICSIPLSVDMKARDIHAIRRTFSQGADCVGLPIDCANPKVYKEVKGGSFNSQINLVTQAAREYPDKVSTHIMVGLGESEKDIVELLKTLYELNVTSGLFAFTPIKGTALEDRPRPDLKSYRRIQIARYLISRGFYPEFDFGKNENIIGFGYPRDELKELLDPVAFQTSGCSDCNRPYYNETPKGAMYNYPCELSSSEYETVLNETLEDGEESD